MHDHDAVWAQTTDGGFLHQLFGYYPTLHDATVRSVSLGGHPLAVTMIVDYLDRIDAEMDANRGQDLAARIRLEWTGVQEFSLPLGDDDLFGLRLFSRGIHIESQLEVFAGEYGSIVSETFDAILMQVDPGPRDEIRWIRYSASVS